MRTLDELRAEIDQIDAQIVALIKQRMKCVHGVGELKKEANSHIFVPERESQLIEKILMHNDGELPEKGLCSIYRQIVSMSLHLEGGVKAGYLGPPGTWSHQAAQSRFGDSVELVPYPSFQQIFRAVEVGEINYGVIPIENSTDGRISQAIDLLGSTELRICAQIHLSVRNCLMANIERTKIRKIYSHSQVLGQCREWLRKNFPKAELVSTASTTVAAKLAHNEAENGAAALGSPLAAEYNGLDVLETNIQDKAGNTTRFAVIGSQTTGSSGRDRTTICFGVPHTAGSLVDVLSVFKEHGINIYCMDSRPTRDTAWEYVFYIDVEGHADTGALKKCVDILRKRTPMFKVLGSYPEN